MKKQKTVLSKLSLKKAEIIALEIGQQNKIKGGISRPKLCGLSIDNPCIPPGPR